MITIVEAPPIEPVHLKPLVEIDRRPIPSCMLKPKSWVPIDVPICDVMTWESTLSLAWVKARWPGQDVRFIRIGRVVAPIDEIPIAQIPYLIVAAKYFGRDMIEYALYPFLNRKLCVALRDIDWLMVNFAKQFDSCYFLERPYRGRLDCFTPGKEIVSIYDMYNNTLHMYRRRHFRTYKQGHRMFLWTDSHFEETTVGQLLCLMWAIEWGVVTFAFARANEIKEHETFICKSNQADIERYRAQGMKRKRMELVARPPSDVWVVESPQEPLTIPSLPTYTISRRARPPHMQYSEAMKYNQKT